MGRPGLERLSRCKVKAFCSLMRNTEINCFTDFTNALLLFIFFFSIGNNFELKDIITQVPAQSLDNCRVRWNCQPTACILCYLCDLESFIYFHKGVKSNPELRGMIPNSFEHIFQHISRSENQQYLVRASYLEIYQVRYSIQRCLHSRH